MEVLLEKVNLLFLHNKEAAQVNMIKFLQSQVAHLDVAHNLNIDLQEHEKINMILIKELGDSESLLHTIKNLKAAKPSLPIILIEKETNIVPYQKVLDSYVNDFISLPINKQLFLNVLQKHAPLNQEKTETEAFGKDLLESVLNLQENLFFLLRKGRLVFKSPFLDSLLSDDEILTTYRKFDEVDEFFSFDSIPNREFHFIVKQSQHELYDTLVTIEPIDVMEYDPEEDNLILSREEFFKYLKKKNLNLRENEQFALCDIRIVNYEELQENFGRSIMLEVMHRIMHFSLSLIPKSKISFWYQESLIMALSENFEDAKEVISSLQKKITHSTISRDIPVKILISVTYVDRNDSIDNCLEKMASLQNTFANNNSDIYVASSYDDIDDDNKKVIAMLEDILQDENSHNSLSATSFYKGLIINNAITDVQLSDKGKLSFKTEAVQCIAMSEETHVLLHSALIPNDILCEVKQINSRERSAQVADFTILTSSYKQRKFSRLMPSKNTNVILSIDTASISGVALDLSINSLSVQVSNDLIKNHANGTELIASINLPSNDKQKSGAVRVNSRILNVFPLNNGYKIVLVFTQNDPKTIEQISNYLKLRQKELLSELKNLLKTA